MALSPAATKLQAQLRAAWIHAARQPADVPFTVPAATKNDAVQLRFKLYNTARKARTEPDTDPALADAISRVGLRVEQTPNGRWQVVFFHNSAIAELSNLLAQVEDVPSAPAPAEPPTPDFSGLMNRLHGEGLLPPTADAAAADPFTTKNPFYTRTGTGQSK